MTGADKIVQSIENHAIHHNQNRVHLIAVVVVIKANQAVTKHIIKKISSMMTYKHNSLDSKLKKLKH